MKSKYKEQQDKEFKKEVAKSVKYIAKVVDDVIVSWDLFLDNVTIKSEGGEQDGKRKSNK